MDLPNDSSQSIGSVARLPLRLLIFGSVLFVGSAILCVRLIWEQTVWTWQLGPQMVGFSLAHGFGAILFLFPILLVGWTVVIAILTVRSLLRGNRIANARWAGLGLIILLFVVMSFPEGFWERAFISQMAASPRGGDLLVYAAYRGDLRTVRALVSNGVAVDDLISMGADVNALDRSGDSPLELATERGQRKAAELLTDHGAKEVRGDDAQRQKAIHDKVRDSMTN